MLRFTDTQQQFPDITDADIRSRMFKEIYANFTDAGAAEQASRCSQCGIPFCQIHCPLQNNIPDWLKLTAEGRLEEAYAMSSATNNFPEICGRICPQDKLCEGNCVVEHGFGTVTIGSIEKYITEHAFANGWVQPTTPATSSPYSVGIIGAGPAGLAAADMLNQNGYTVTVYDRYDRVGGLLIYGIPNFKLEKEVVKRRWDLLAKSGIKFELGTHIGTDIRFHSLQEKHHAMLITTGVYKARTLTVPGSNLNGIIPALEYLTASNRKGLGDDVPEFNSGKFNAEGKRVIVVGGGDTAMDCVRTAVRQGAKKVSCLYRRDRINMPGSLREVKNAEEEGVHFEWLSSPKGFIGNTQIESVLMQHMRLSAPDKDGRQAVIPIEDETSTMKADMVIQALGFEPEDMPTMFDVTELAVRKNGTLEVNPVTLMTNKEGVFAAGDIVRGASLVVWAIKDGRDAAKSINDYLRTHHMSKAA